MKKLLIAIIFICLTIQVTAQISPFLEKGQSGAGMNAGIEKGYGFNSFTAGIGASFGGKIDFEAGSYNTSYDSEKVGLLDDKAKSRYIEVHLTWWLLKAELLPNLNLNIGANPVFFNSDYTNYRYVDETNVVTYDGYTGGALGLVTNIVYRSDKGWIFIPSYRCHYQINRSHKSVALTDNSDTYTGLTSSFSAAIGKSLGKSGTVYLSLRQFDDTYKSGAYYDITVGYVIPF